MQFVRNGPDVPERLLQAHEDGRVVFFCGAGISYPAGLPTFDGLVRKLYEKMGIDPDPMQAKAIKAGRYDIAVGLLETKVMGGRQAVRKELADILTPSPDTLATTNATATHQALLTLGKTRDGRTRLITTNFDRLFEGVMEKSGNASLPVERFRAPSLPTPKNRWDGLVYLHGLLTPIPSAIDLERLVVSSGDFGLAYLTERWAARFVSDLFRNYTVCFVGYSIDDPVLRYMMDAHAADRLLGESSPEMFAFGVHSKGKEAEAGREWESRNVTPILYRMHWHHFYLHRTLRAWSEMYRDGVRGKERIIVEYALASPRVSTEQDDFVGRMLWALSDPSGLPAKRFAEFDPVPSLDWLKPLSKNCFGYADLARFGVPPKAEVDRKLAFSLIRRPGPYERAPRMALVVDRGMAHHCWDDVMAWIARWLVRHLDDPDLLLCFVKRGDPLHERMAKCIEFRLEELARLETQGDSDELDRIRANAPAAIPRPKMRTLWNLLLIGRVRIRADNSDLDICSWRERFGRDGLTTTLRLELREKLMPRVSLREPLSWWSDGGNEDREAEESSQTDGLPDVEVVLSTSDVRPVLRELAGEERWTEALPDLLPDFTGLLRDALDLRRELGDAHDREDRSSVDQPSISEHPQNAEFRDWTVLIELVRDAWCATSTRFPGRARAVAEAWWQIPYPVFRRLAFFAAAQPEIVPRCQALDWLLAEDAWWLWSPETLREAMRLLVALAPRLDEAEWARLERAILVGPPRDMYKAGIEPESWIRIQDGEVWLRLAKSVEAEARLSPGGAARMEALSIRYPEWRLAENERDEFSVWMGSGREGRKRVVTPRDPHDLAEWLKANADTDRWYQDDWPRRCREEFEATTSALSKLALQEGVWPRRRWREALQAWLEEELIERSWRAMLSILSGAPEEVLQALDHGIGFWLQKVSRTIDGEEDTFLSLCDRVLALDYEGEGEFDDPVSSAINHPIGHVTQALLEWWFWSPLEDGQGLPDDLISRFSAICDTRVGKFRHGRVLLATQVVALFRVDSGWTTRNVLPLFDWRRSRVEARSAWGGFLRSPRLHRPLMEVLKSAFLDTANHYAELGRHAAQYPSLLTFAALEPEDIFTRREMATAVAALPQEGRDESAETLARALEGAGTQGASYWRNRVVPYLQNVWPQTHDAASVSVARSFARLCVGAEDEFPEALEKVRPWLQPLKFPEPIVRRLHGSNIHRRFPESTLEFLDLIIADEALPPKKLPACLSAIRAAAPELEKNQKFRGLVDHLHRHRKAVD